MQKFIARQDELNALQKKYDSNHFEFIAIYGRRRVGKTKLLQEFCEDKNTIFYAATAQNDQMALSGFSEQIIHQYPELSAIMSSFESWQKAFEFIAQKSSDQRILLIIDEYPYLAENNPSISSVLQHVIDHFLIHTKLMLILCGSSTSFMENQVLGAKSPLYGRRTGQLKIKPLDYLDSAKFFEHWTDEEKLKAYMTVGGVPYYLIAFSRYDSYRDAIIGSFLSADSILLEEPNSFLNQTTRSPANYHSVIRMIANGATKVNEMASRLGQSTSKISASLATLIELGLVKKKLPFGAKKGKGYYKIKDSMYCFYYRFVVNNISLIMRGQGELVYDSLIAPKLNEHFGIPFESVCIEYLYRHYELFPELIANYSNWWGADPKEKKSIEIDIVGTSDNYVVLGECKWRNSSVDIDALERLQRNAQCLHQNKQPIYILFSKSGFDTNLQSIDENVILVEMKELLN